MQHCGAKYYKILGKIKIQKQQKEQVRNIFSDGFKLPMGGQLNCWEFFLIASIVTLASLSN